MEKINHGKYVELVYDIYEVAQPKEVLMFQFTEAHPDRFVFGSDMGMLEGFKKNIEGLSAGDTFDFTLTPEEAFGEYLDNFIYDFPRETFEVDGVFQEDKVAVGKTVEMLTAEGHRVAGEVLSVGETVKVDFNHPLAGQSLHYTGRVLTVREATVEELNPKSCSGCSCGCGDEGHDHGGCDCGSCGGCC